MNPNKTILIADDDVDFVAVLRERLDGAGYNTICAYEGVRTIQQANASKPDLILLDWKMPAGDGGAVLASLAKNDSTRQIPVIIITGADETGIDERAKEFKVRGILRKPIDAKKLIKKVNEIFLWQSSL